MGDSVHHGISILGGRNLRNFELNREAFKEGQGSCRAVKPMVLVIS
jgi:hypothetical protein